MVYQITIAYVPGKPLDELPENIQATAVQKADLYINNTVLPQLASLTSDCTGSLTGDIIPPRRVAEQFPDKVWAPRKAPTVFCHDDLGQHNILCDPPTGDVLYIIDWEYAGYYHQSFEGRLWLKPYHETEHDKGEVACLEQFLTECGSPLS